MAELRREDELVGSGRKANGSEFCTEARRECPVDDRRRLGAMATGGGSSESDPKMFCEATAVGAAVP